MSFAVTMERVTKRFGQVTALEEVSLHVPSGTIHAIVGENGAGKTTLMRILYGALRADSGTMSLDGKPVHFQSSAQAIAAGVGMVSQHYAIIPELTCLQNLVLGAEGGMVLNARAAEQRADALARRMGFQFEWHRPASELSPAGAQKLEILKLLWRRARIMILDEPTAMLSPADSDALFASLGQLTAEGATVLLVTHRLPEVLDHCAHVTVLRGGRLVEERPVAGATAEMLAQRIIGGALPGHEPPPARAPGEPVLAVHDLTVLGDRGEVALKSVSLTARAGEIVGIAGVDGSGQRELFHAIAGVRRAVSGSVQMSGEDRTQQPTSDRLKGGLRIIPEDRHEEGIVESWSLEENAALGLQRLPPLARGSRVDVAARKRWAQQVAERFRTRHGGLSHPMASLSGGNQQRFVAARAICKEPSVLLAFQPARGLDLGGTVDVYRAIREACDAGATAVVVSFDLDELLEHCDRIVVMHGGTLAEPPASHAKDRDLIGRLMVGAA